MDKLKATLRSPEGAQCGFRATCNPGGVGHNWVKARYIDAGPNTIVEESFTDPFTGRKLTLSRVFIPAKLADNPKLLANDPDYVARLQLSGSEELVRAWLEGDWNVIHGAFCDKWSARNIVTPFAMPSFWLRFRSFDWGFAAPFSCGWWAVPSDPWPTANGVHSARSDDPLPRVVRPGGPHRRGPAADGRGGGGRHRRAGGWREDRLWRRRSVDLPPGRRALDRRAPAADGTLLAAGGQHPGGQAGALSGWDQMRARIAGGEDGPMLYVFDTCRDFIRTVPVLQHDPERLDDLDTSAEDHIADETRYACLSRPLPAPPPPPPAQRPEWDWDRMRRDDPHTHRWNWKTM